MHYYNFAMFFREPNVPDFFIPDILAENLESDGLRKYFLYGGILFAVDDVDSFICQYFAGCPGFAKASWERRDNGRSYVYAKIKYWF